MNRQDSVTEQMWDVLVDTYSINPLLAVSVSHLFFGPSHPLSDLVVEGEQNAVQVRQGLQQMHRQATQMGCYDAADWIRYRALGQLQGIQKL